MGNLDAEQVLGYAVTLKHADCLLGLGRWGR